MIKRLRSLLKRTYRKYRFDPARARFHFIHIPKNAGESVRDALYYQRDVSLSSPFHYRYVDIANKVGKHLRFFAVVRNPWSRTASRYHFARQNAAHWASDDPRRLYIEKATFADFVRDRRIFPIPEHPGQPWMGPLNSWFNQLDWIRDEKGEVVCDCLRMETLDSDLPAYLDRVLRIRQRNTTQLKYDFRSMYTDALADLVAEVFCDDIAYFGFTFEGAATRNVFDGTRDPAASAALQSLSRV
jgi:hypothetical protein